MMNRIYYFGLRRYRCRKASDKVMAVQDNRDKTITTWVMSREDVPALAQGNYSVSMFNFKAEKVILADAKAKGYSVTNPERCMSA